MSERMKMKVEQIPNGSMVSRPKGAKEYNLIRELIIYESDAKFKNIDRTNMIGYFMVGTNPVTITKLPPDAILDWHVPEDIWKVIQGLDLSKQSVD